MGDVAHGRQGIPVPVPRRLPASLGNDHLVAHAWAVEGFNDLVDIAHTWNENLWVIEVCNAVMKDLESGRLVRKHGHRVTCMSDADELRGLLARHPSGDSAIALLLVFRAEHDARCRRGENFFIAIKSMIEKETCGHWGARKYRVARDILLREGLIEEVIPACGTRSAEYRLADRVLTPSVAEQLKRSAGNA